MQSLNRVAATGKKSPALTKVEHPGSHLQRFVDAFRVLDRSRPVHMDGPGYIPLSEIEAYSRIYEVGDAMFFSDLIMEIDRRVMAARYEVLTKKRKANESKKRRGKKGSIKRGGRRR